MDTDSSVPKSFFGRRSLLKAEFHIWKCSNCFLKFLTTKSEKVNDKICDTTPSIWQIWIGPSFCGWVGCLKIMFFSKIMHFQMTSFKVMKPIVSNCHSIWKKISLKFQKPIYHTKSTLSGVVIISDDFQSLITRISLLMLSALNLL